jgi:hypothetical protein
MKLLLAISTLVLASCAAHTAEELKESRLEFANTAPNEIAITHDVIGDVVTAEPSEFDGDEEAARAQIRYRAARRGADLVVIDRAERFPCELNPERSCVYLKGTAYRKRSEEDVASARAAIAAALAAQKAASDAVSTESAAPARKHKKKKAEAFKSHRPTGGAERDVSSSAAPRK